MPILDFSLPIGSRLTMGNSEELDLLPALAGFSLSQPIVDLSQPLIWTAKITLEAVLGFPESLDKVDNYSRWQRGKHPIRLYLDDTLIVTLRLKSYHFDEDSGFGELTATDILGLLDFDRTTSSNSDFKQRAQTLYVGERFYPFMPRSLAVQRVLVNGSLLADGIQYLSDSRIITDNLPTYSPDGQPDGFTVDQGTGKTNPVKHSSEIVGAIGYWLWCDPHENIRFAKYPTDVVAPVRRYARSEVEEFKPKEPDFDNSPPSTVTAVGTHLVSCKVLNKNDPEEKKLIPPGFGVTYPIVSEAKGDGGVIVQRTTRDGSDTDPYNRVTVEKSLASLMPDDHPNDNTLAVANDRANAADYNEQGYLVQRVTTDAQPLGVIAKDLFPGEIALADTLTTEAWTYVEGVPLQQSVITTQPGFAVFADQAAGAAQTLYEGTLTTWTPIGTRKYEQQVIKTKPKGTLANATDPYDATPTIVNPTEPTFVDAPPEAPRKPAPAPVVAKPEKAEAKVAPNGEPNGYAGNGSIVRFSCCSGLENARAIAQFQAHLEWQRHAAYNVTRPFDPTVDLSFAPFQREDVHTKGLIRDGYTIAIGSDGLSVAYTGNLIGSIAQVPDPYEARAIVPDLSSPTPALALAPVFALTFAVNVPITSFSLVASGGTGTYTYSASGLPAGLSLSGNVVSGVPTAIGSSTVTFSVHDGVSVVSQITSVAIASAPIPLPFWQLILSAESGCYSRESVSVRLMATAESGSYWQDEAGIKPAPPVVTIDSGSYWQDEAVAAMAAAGSYWQDSAIERPVITAASGSYWRDRAYERLTLTAESGSFWRDSVTSGSGADAAYVAAHLPNVPATQRQTVANAAFAAASALADGSTQYDLIDTLAARVSNWLCFLPGAIYTDTAGTTLAVSGDGVARVDPWIGSLKAQVYSTNPKPVLTTANGLTFDGSSTYLVTDTATFALPATFTVARKLNATFNSGNYPAIYAFRTGSISKGGIAASNEINILSGVGIQGGSDTATNKIYLETLSNTTAGEINGTAIDLTNFSNYDQGVTLPNATGFNLVYGAEVSTSGSKTAAIGADSFSSGRYWQGEIADLIWLNTTPSTTEKMRLTAFFKTLWGIT